MKKKVCLIVATHKQYEMPKDDLYLPIQVGAYGKDSIGYQRDDTGDNISDKNNMYCELTGLYWAWKNIDADYIGLVHYRRYFRGKGRGKSPFDKILTQKEAKYLLKRYDIIVPKKRKYYIESLYSHYVHTHYEMELVETRKIINELFPEYVASYDKTMKRTSGYMFNMMITNRKLLDDYCEWLFSILDELVNRIDVSERTDFEKRYPGRVSELLFNTWLDYKIECGYVSERGVAELPFIYMEKIDYVSKITGFLKAKFLHTRHSHSF